MIEKESMDFVIAIAFTTGMIMLVVGMYGFHLVVSGKRLRKAHRFANAGEKDSLKYCSRPQL